MPADRVISYPADAQRRVADRLMDENPMLDGDEAMDLAFDLTIEITEAVDKLRAIEADEAEPEQAYKLGRALTVGEAIVLARRATFDPGIFTKQRIDHNGLEQLHRWQARAVVIALGENGPTFEHRWGNLAQALHHPHLPAEIEDAQEARDESSPASRDSQETT